MFTLLFLAMISTLLFTVSQSLSSGLDRMSLAFGVAHKPYEPAPKPKGKGVKDKFMHLMARAKYSGIGVVAMSGKINGTVFLSNNVVRVWRLPNNVRNGFTQFVRGMFSGTSTAWKSLTAAQILSWTSASASYFSRHVLGVSYQLKGNAIFQRVNNILASIGLTPMASCPGIATPTFIIVSGVAVADASAQSVTAALTDFNAGVVLPANTYVKAYATSPRDIGQSSFGASDYRYIGFYNAGTSTAPLVLTTDYIARFGAIAVNQRIGLAFEVITTDATTTFGKSGRFYLSTVVVP